MSDIKSSCERICAEFEAQGRPAAPAMNSLPGVNSAPQQGEYSIELEVKTPEVGSGFVKWGTSGWDPEGKASPVPPGVDYDKKGDWLFDKQVAPDTKAYRGK